MRYVVMECHTSYAVVLAEDGRFLNVANMHYEVGQTVNDVFEMQLPTPMRKKHRGRWVTAITAVAACFILFFAGVFQNLRLPYASVYMSINPSVRIDVKKDNEVMDIEAMNSDGEKLIASYSYDDKHLDIVTEELVDLAIQMGYLSDGGEIRLTFDAEDDEWELHTGNELRGKISDMLTDKMSVTISLDDDDEDDEFENIVIPIAPDNEYDDDDYLEDNNILSSGSSNGGNSNSGTSGNRPTNGSSSGDSSYNDSGDSGFVQQPSGDSSNNNTDSDDGDTDYVPPVNNSGSSSEVNDDSGYNSSGDSDYSSSDSDYDSSDYDDYDDDDYDDDDYDDDDYDDDD